MEGAKNFSDNQRKRRKKKNSENWKNRISFSASLPAEVSGGFADGTICLVKYSTDPFSDMRESILEMIQSVGVQDWEELEELVYCYIVLNPSEVHGFIEDAFLSLCSSVAQIDH
ncbi:Transcription repressor like [Actinidia chinensis var. chinensis]|uniref:Transcription repressor n=1 Tax=Actinidia chinensis var. chinensis TaxID=1590841 RepID=A0A2R6RSD2_ACTCC|nr:Transcription repressor like [Actinidia chinensis var. chinensis]